MKGQTMGIFDRLFGESDINVVRFWKSLETDPKAFEALVSILVPRNWNGWGKSLSSAAPFLTNEQQINFQTNVFGQVLGMDYKRKLFKKVIVNPTFSYTFAPRPPIYKIRLFAQRMKKREPTVSNMVTALKNHSDPCIREISAWLLGEMGQKLCDRQVVEPLIDVLNDSDFDVQGRASEALRKVGKIAVELLIAELKKGGYKRRRIPYILGEIGDQRAVSALEEALNDESEFVKSAAAEALQKINPPGSGRHPADLVTSPRESAEILIKSLPRVGGSIFQAGEGLDALVKIGVPAMEPILESLEAKYEDDLADALIKIIKNVEDRDTAKSYRVRLIELIVRLLIERSLNYWIGRNALRKVAQIIEKEDFFSMESRESLLNILLVTLNNYPDDALWRSGTAEALGKINDSRSVDALIAAINDKDGSVRRAVVLSLGELGDIKAVEPLIVALKDEKWGYREDVAKALGILKDPRAVDPLIVALKDKSRLLLPDEAAKALGEIGDKRAIEPLKKAAETKDFVLRQNVKEALEKIQQVNS